MKNLFIRLITAIMMTASLCSVYAAPAYETFNINETFERAIPYGWTADEGIYSVSEENGNKALKIESGENGNTVIKTTENFEHFVIAEIDIFYSENTTETTYLPVFKNSDGAAILKTEISEDGTLTFVGKKTNKTSVTMKENEWNHFRYNINMYSGIYAVAVNDDMPVKNASMTGSFPSALSSMEFTFEGQGEIMIDNLLLRNTGRVYEDFSGGTKAALADGGFVNFTTVGIQESPVDEEDYCVMSSSGNPRISFPAITEFGVVEFDIMFSDITKTRPSIIFANSYSGLKGASVLKSGGNALYTFLYNGGTQNMAETAFSSETWYHARMELDIENQLYTFLMSSDSSSEPVIHMQGEFYESYEYIDSVIFETKQKFYIDNFEAWNKEISAPVVSAVAVTAPDGGEVDGIDLSGGNIPTEIETVSIEISVNDEGKGIETTVDRSSVTAETVYFFDMKENRNVKINNFLYDELTGKATFSVEEYLNANGDYSLMVTNGVKNTLGYKLSNLLKMKLQPVPEKIYADIDNATAEITEEGINILIPAVNYGVSEIPINVITGIYSEDGSVKQSPVMLCDTVPSTGETYMSKVTLPAEITVSAGDMLKVFVWDENNVPVCDEIVISLAD